MTTRIFILATILFQSAFIYAQKYFDTTFQVMREIVYFESNQAEIRDIDTTVLQEISARASEFDSVLVRIGAHTDSDGAPKSNLNLSYERAESVRNYLEQQGLDSTSLSVEFFGESKPDQSNSSEEGKAANRRVAVQLFAKRRMTWIYGHVLNDSTELPVHAQVFLYAKNFSDSTFSDTAGAYRLVAPIREEVVIEVKTSEYLPQFLSVVVNPVTTSKPLDIRTVAIKVGGNFKLLNLLFFGNQSRPLPGSLKPLKVLGKFLADHPGVCIEIQGHINLPRQARVEQKTWEFALSVARARVVYDYLQLFHRISVDRMYYKGYGNSRMLFPAAVTERLQRLNRRVEIHICHCDDSKGEINNSGNSRYKFYVLEGKDNMFN